MQQGWIRLHRSLTEHWLHEDKPFGRFGAWVDLLLMANHDTRKIAIGGQLSPIERGQLFTSTVSLSARWGWSRGKVERFLELLENDSMLTRKRTSNGQLLTLVNYGLYQDSSERNGQLTDSRRTADGQPTDTNKELKNDKNVKNEKKDTYTSDIAEVLDYLNSRTGKNFTGKSKAHRQHITARLKEGFTVEDFKKVIDNKVAAWGRSEKMAPYLRPETLFSTKFETYLNDVETERQKERREDELTHEKQREALRRTNEVEIGYYE